MCYHFDLVPRDVTCKADFSLEKLTEKPANPKFSSKRWLLRMLIQYGLPSGYDFCVLRLWKNEIILHCMNWDGGWKSFTPWPSPHNLSVDTSIVKAFCGMSFLWHVLYKGHRAFSVKVVLNNHHTVYSWSKGFCCWLRAQNMSNPISVQSSRHFQSSKNCCCKNFTTR